MTYSMKPKPCKKHSSDPARIYNACIGCEIEDLRLKNKKLEEEVKRLRDERGQDVGVKCVTVSAREAN